MTEGKTDNTSTGSITLHPFELKTKQPFGIARWSHSIYPRVLVRWHWAGQVGLGEAAPNAFYGETGATALAALQHYIAAAGQPTEFWTLQQRLLQQLGGNASARSALEMAALDVVAKRAQLNVAELLGLVSARPIPISSYTIGISDLGTMTEQVKAAIAAGQRVFKIKLGTERDEEILTTMREAVGTATLRVDANAAWTYNKAKRMLGLLEECGVELLEQPLPAQDLRGHALLRQHSSIPIIADESLHGAHDVPALAEAFDGVNLKVSKLGGVLETLRTLEAARAHHMAVMVGCMMESSLGLAAAALVAPFTDWVDLDASLLLEKDPARGLLWLQSGQLVPLQGLGFGVEFEAS